MLLFLFFSLTSLSLQDNSTPVKYFNITQTGLIGSLLGDDDDLIMKPPFYVVPIEPEEPEQFNKLVRFDLETGDIYLKEIYDTIKFSALSINQGSALTVVLNLFKPIDKLDLNCFNLIDGTKSLSQFDSVDKCYEIDSRVFANNSCELKRLELSFECDKIIKLNQKNLNEVTIEKQINNSILLNLKCILNEYSFNLKLVGVSLFKEENQFYLLNPQAQCNQTITSLVKLNKFSLNLKIYLIILITLVSTLIGFLLFIANLVVRRFVVSKDEQSKFPFKSSILSVNTIDTRASVLIDYFDQSLNPDTNKLILDEKNLSSKLHFSTGYLSQMGINVLEDLKDLKEKNLLEKNYVNSTPSTECGKVSQDEVVDLTVKKWCSLLDWDVDYATYSNVFDDLSKLKKSNC